MRYFLILLLALGACTHTPQTTQAYLTKKGVTPPTQNTLQHCRGYGCQYIDEIELSAKQWSRIKSAMQPPAQTPAQERTNIAKTIGIFETIIGAKNGTHEDIKGTFKKTGTYQLDCVDESTNTTTYMLALQNRGLITHHDIRAPAGRFPIIHSGRWPHQAALVQEKTTQNLFVIDSWFHDNGAPAEIIPLKQWKDGWKPEEEQ